MADLLRVDSARFAHETIEGETVVIDALEGRLTVLTGFAASAFDSLAAGTTGASLVHEAVHRYGDHVRLDVEQLIDELVQAGFTVPFAGGSDSDGGEVVVATESWAPAYVAPSVEHYDDIADIMTMDPIHEVDLDRGWPRSGQAS